MKHEAKQGSGKKMRQPPVSLMNAKPEASRVIKATAKNDGQKNALRSIDQNVVTIIEGRPGTGKTYLAVSYGLQMFRRGKVKRIVITRPYIEAGEHLGFLPGSVEEKTAPFLMPIYDTLGEHLTKDEIHEMLDLGQLVIVPIAHMRGLTFKGSYVVCDEAQNLTRKQFHMLLTRIGDDSKVVITGDVAQSDIGRQSGLEDAMERLAGVEGLETVRLDASSIVRHPIVAAIDARYADQNQSK